MREFFIDEMGEGDIEAVATLASGEGGYEPDDLQIEALQLELSHPWSRRWVARTANGQVVGFLIAWHVVDELHVINIATRIDQRRRGIARALLDHAIHDAKSRHIKRALLEVRRSNQPAIELYLRVGFAPFHVRPRYYSDDEDAIEMSMLLDLAPTAMAAEVVPEKRRT